MPLLNVKLFSFSKKPRVSPELNAWRETNRRILRFVGICFLIAGILSPHRYTLKTQAIAAARDQRTVSTIIPGTIAKILVTPGQKVSTNEALLELKNPEINARVAIAKLEFDQLKLKLLQLQSSPDWEKQSQALEIQEGLKSAEALLIINEKQLEGLTLRSPIEGNVLTPNLSRIQGSFVPEATPLVSVGDTDHLKLLIPIPEVSMRYISKGDPVKGIWTSTGKPLQGHIERIPLKKAAFPNDYFDAIYTRFGGPAPKQQFQSMEEASEINYPIYIAEASIENYSGGYHPDMRAQIYIETRTTLFALHIKDKLSQLFH